jgi:hypothetical protein
MTILDTYLILADLAGHNENALINLIHCFADDATLIAENDNTPYVGKVEIEQFYRSFYQQHKNTTHIWKINQDKQTPQMMKADWAVIGRLLDDTPFSRQGTDIAEINADNKIQKLTIASRTSVQ